MAKRCHSRAIETSLAHCESEGHHEELIVSFVCSEGGLRHVLLGHSNLVITRLKVDCREETCTMQFVVQLLDHWNRKFCFEGVLVSSIINAETTLSILLSHQHHWHSILLSYQHHWQGARTGAVSDYSSVLQLLDNLIHLVLVQARIATRARTNNLLIYQRKAARTNNLFIY